MMKYFFITTFCISANLLASDFFKGKSTIENPFTLRDPFDVPTRSVEKEAPKLYEETRDGIYTNLPNLEALTDITMDKLIVTGIIFGKKRRAFVKIKSANQDKKSYILKEGMIIGTNEAELKAILPNGIVLVEKLINVYGEEEYLETVIPITR